MLRTSLLASFTLGLFACTSAATTPGSDSVAQSLEPLVASADSFHFTTTSGNSDAPAPSVDVTVTNASVVRSLFSETISLTAFPPGTYNCPEDSGVVYHLVFTSGKTTTTADIDPGGCEMVVLDGSTSGALSASAQYWQDLASALNVEESTIYPYQPPTESDGAR